jgi:hypothetical protein
MRYIGQGSGALDAWAWGKKEKEGMMLYRRRQLSNVLAASGVGGVSLQESLAVEGLEAFRAANTSRPGTGPPLGRLARRLVAVTVASHGLFALPRRLSTPGANEPEVQVRHVDVHRKIGNMSRMSWLALLTVPIASSSAVTMAPSPGAVLQLAIIEEDAVALAQVIDYPLHTVGPHGEGARALVTPQLTGKDYTSGGRRRCSS